MSQPSPPSIQEYEQSKLCKQLSLSVGMYSTNLMVADRDLEHLSIVISRSEPGRRRRKSTSTYSVEFTPHPRLFLGPEIVVEARRSPPPPPLPLFNPPMKTLTWNCCGAVNPYFRQHFVDMMGQHQPHLVIVTETGIGGEPAQRLSESLGFTNTHAVDPTSSGGGIWILWNDLEIHGEVQVVNQREIHGFFQVPLGPLEM